MVPLQRVHPQPPATRPTRTVAHEPPKQRPELGVRARLHFDAQQHGRVVGQSRHRIALGDADLREFAADATPVLMADPSGLRLRLTLGQLLPASFGPAHLREPG